MSAVAVDAGLEKPHIKFGIKSAYPFRRFLKKIESCGYIPVWYPWFYVTLQVEMDTLLKKGMSYADLVAVDTLRPVKERLHRMPETLESDFSSGIKLDPRISEEEAAAEAVELIKGIVLNRNKLLTKHRIDIKSHKLVYHKTFVVQLTDKKPEDWLYIDTHFQAATTLKKRPEVLSHIQD